MKDRLFTLLKCLDERLEQRETLVVCGGFALLLAYGGSRATMDIDVIAPIPLNNHLREKVEDIAREFDDDSQWLNDASKGFVDYLLPDWEQRLVPIDLSFKLLELLVVGRVDLIMMKLRAARPKDLADVQELKITQTEADFILNKLNYIASFDAKTAHTVQLILEEWNFVTSTS